MGRYLGIALASLLLLVTGGRALASTVLAMDLAELVARADGVVLGTVTSRQSVYDDHRRIVTDSVVRVTEVMKGSPREGDELTVRTLGGAIGNIGMRVEGEPVLVVGQRSLFFLRRSTNGYYRPLGMSQGMMRIQSSANGDMVMPSGGGLALVRRDAGRLSPAQSAMTQPRPLGDLLEEIRNLVERNAPADSLSPR